MINDTIRINYNVNLSNCFDFGELYTSNNDERIAFRLVSIPCTAKEYALTLSKSIGSGFNYPDPWSGSNCQHQEEGKYHTKYNPLIHNAKD